MRLETFTRRLEDGTAWTTGWTTEEVNEGDIVARQYDEAGEPLIQVQVFNDAMQSQSEKMLLTKVQVADLEAQLPEGWYIEEYP